MPHWMIHPQHGVKDCYGMSEVQSLTAHGWSLLNSGDAPDYSKKAAPVAAPIPPAPTPTPVERAMSEETAKALTEEVPPESSDILDGTVVQIVALFPTMTKAELESLRAREEAGKTRKGLMKALDEAIEAR